MLVAQILSTIKDIRLYFKVCKIFVGKNPAYISAPAIIFFPVIPFQLNCGFAGLMTFRARQKSASLNADLELMQLWDKIKRSSLENVLAGDIVAKAYMCGLDVLTSMEKAALELKRESAQETLFFQKQRAKKLSNLADAIKAFLAQEEKMLEDQAVKFTSADLETINRGIILLKDIQWTLGKDILANFDKITAVSGAAKPTAINPAAFKKYRKINFLLNSLDRLEVRGRDSAGLQIVFTLENEKTMENIMLELKEKSLYEDYWKRSREGDLANGSIRVAPVVFTGSKKGINITFTYKTFSIVGELGRNVRDLRQVIREDQILQCFAPLDTACETAITHTRWASVGSITEENCHPINNFKPDQAVQSFPFYPKSKAQINIVLNGDIDNYSALRADLETRNEWIAPEITTDTKAIPLQIEKYLMAGDNLADSFRLALKDFDGSHAIAMTSDLEPGKVFLALKGSGQSIYVGIGSDQYMFSSELYGLVEVMPNFIKMNGESNVDGENSAAGQIFILDQNSCGGLAGIAAYHYDGTKISLKESEIQKAEMTTRDIDRGAYPHFFLKEIFESVVSIRKTLRGKYRILTSDKSLPQVIFNLGADIVPEAVRVGLQNGAIKNIIVIGHGTAAVAGLAIADALESYLKGRSLNIMARVASELSGFLLKDDLSDTLVIPITQSGTTTDTNRAVAMAKERGAFIISIVNRRQSDITTKSHGIFYTSDGRDIEMSVASTKAFYSQIIAGQVLALFLAQVMKTRTDDYIVRELHNLETVPKLMARVFERRTQISASVDKTLAKKFWAVVGSGPNKAAADEIRIKLSELCYKTISSDIVENKKHIDLSAEPLILVCASGNPEPVVEDIAKDVAIFKAHKAAVIVFAEEGDDRFDKIADAVIPIPSASMPLPVILNTMAGHLWGYYAACAIDKEALVFREFRNRLNLALTEQAKINYSLYERIADPHFRHLINDFYHTFNGQRNDGAFNLLGVKTISDLALLLKYAAGKLPLEDFRHEFRNEDSPLDLLDITLGKAIDELTRPIDAIRHQAKTVTVGTSRKEKILRGVVFDLLEKLKFAAKNLTYKNILAVSRVQPAVLTVRGYTLYKINNLDEAGNPAEGSTIVIKEKGGIARKMISRAEKSHLLMGTKRTIVSTGNIYMGKGKADAASILVLPLLGENGFVGNLLLLHIEYNEALSLREKKMVLGYRYNDIRNLVDEYNVNWDDNYLEKISLVDLFSEPVENLAGRIKQYSLIES